MNWDLPYIMNASLPEHTMLSLPALIPFLSKYLSSISKVLQRRREKERRTPRNHFPFSPPFPENSKEESERICNGDC